jgi:SecY interacting protein Syd
LWNAEDFDRLIANLIGHALAKQKSRHEFTVFIANTDPDTEVFLSIDNSSGAILLEEPGKPPLCQVEADIHTFLRRLKPKNRPTDIY